MASQRELVEYLFETALALKPIERKAFLDEMCSSDPTLRRMLEDLLGEDERAVSFLQHPPFESFDKPSENISSDAEETKPIVGDGMGSTTAAIAGLKLGEILMGRFRVVRALRAKKHPLPFESRCCQLQRTDVFILTR